MSSANSPDTTSCARSLAVSGAGGPPLVPPASETASGSGAGETPAADAAAESPRSQQQMRDIATCTTCDMGMGEVSTRGTRQWAEAQRERAGAEAAAGAHLKKGFGQ